MTMGEMVASFEFPAAPVPAPPGTGVGDPPTAGVADGVGEAAVGG